MQIKAGDTVVVIAGKDKYTKDKKGNLIPTTGKVLKVFPKENKVLVEGVIKLKNTLNLLKLINQVQLANKKLQSMLLTL